MATAQCLHTFVRTYKRTTRASVGRHLLTYSRKPVPISRRLARLLLYYQTRAVPSTSGSHVNLCHRPLPKRWVQSFTLAFSRVVFMSWNALYPHAMTDNPCGAKRKRCRALDSCFRLISPHQQSIPHPYLHALRNRVPLRAVTHSRDHAPCALSFAHYKIFRNTYTI